MSDAIGAAYVLGKINGLSPAEAWEIISARPTPYHWNEWAELDDALKEKARTRWETEGPYYSTEGEVPPTVEPEPPVDPEPEPV